MQFIICIYFLFLFFVQDNSIQSSSLMYWREDLKLTWENFKGQAPKESQYEAMTASGIEYSYAASNKNGKLSFTFQVRSYFNPETSWVKESSRTDDLLLHERGHFDISELHARLLNKALNNTTFSSNYKEEINEIYQSIIDQRAQMQEQYDRETDHSRNKDKQIEWTKRIEYELRELK